MSDIPEWRDLPYPLWKKLLYVIVTPVVLGAIGVAAYFLLSGLALVLSVGWDALAAK